MRYIRPLHLKPANETTRFSPAIDVSGSDTKGGCSNGYTLQVWNQDMETQGG